MNRASGISKILSGQTARADQSPAGEANSSSRTPLSRLTSKTRLEALTWISYLPEALPERGQFLAALLDGSHAAGVLPFWRHAPLRAFDGGGDAFGQ